MTNTQNYSVLMSVYHKEKPEYLHQSMQSIYEQTLPTNDFVVVCDGPLTDGLNDVLAEMKKLFSTRLNIVRLSKNGGLGNALNIGMKHCANELIARMDSDDISHLDRCEKEVAFLMKHPEISIIGGYIEEFIDDVSNICSVRSVPNEHSDIIEFAKRRNPFNHVSVMYRKSAVEAAGGYQSFFLMEDYYLWIRMLTKGYRGHNLSFPLVWVRVGKDMYKRRGGWKYVQSQRNLFKYMAQTRFITGRQYQIQSLVRLIGAIIPNWLRAILFQKLLRN